MKVDLFDFELPPDLIALRPVSPRDAARQLIVHPDGRLSDDRVSGLAAHLNPGDVLVFNDTRDIPARLTGRRTGRGGSEPVIEVTLHQRTSDAMWLAFAKPGRKLNVGDNITFADDLAATVRAKNAGGEIQLDFDVGGAERRQHQNLEPRFDFFLDNSFFVQYFATKVSLNRIIE